MNNKPVLFLDSGIGGILYCSDFLKKNPYEEICYIADRKHFPYGQRGKEELISILLSLTEKILKEIDPKIIVLACNTATVSALDSLRKTFAHVPFVGTVPAIKPAAAQSKKRKIGLLGTSRTIEDPYNLHLVDCASCIDVSGEAQSENNSDEKRCEIISVAAPDLVEFIEKQFDKADENEKTAIVKKYINIFLNEVADCIVLGCTHFLYLLDIFKREAAPSIAVYDSLDGITKRIEFLLNERNSFHAQEETKRASRRLMLTGNEPPDASWQKRADSLGFKLSLFN